MGGWKEKLDLMCVPDLGAGIALMTALACPIMRELLSSTFFAACSESGTRHTFFVLTKIELSFVRDARRPRR